MKKKVAAEEITVRPIGIIHTPYKELSEVPIHGELDRDTTGRIEIYDEYREGLKDLEGFSHAILLFRFDRATEEALLAKPPFDSETHGVFATRSPRRPNRIGLSIVKLIRIDGAVITFSGIDMVDETPLLDIKPYFPFGDDGNPLRLGWFEKYAG